jgi:hypothetical protein
MSCGTTGGVMQAALRTVYELVSAVCVCCTCSAMVVC